STSTAWRPPKAFRSPSTISTGSGLGTPGTGATSESICPPFPSASQESLRSIDHQQHQSHTHEDVFDQPGLSRCQQITDPADIRLQLRHKGVDREEEEVENGGAEDRSPDGARPSEDHDHIEDEADPGL